jgi:hypothetical protein
MINLISSDIMEYVKLISMGVGILMTILFFAIVFLNDND